MRINVAEMQGLQVWWHITTQQLFPAAHCSITIPTRRRECGLHDPWGSCQSRAFLKSSERRCSLYTSCSAGRSAISMSIKTSHTLKGKRLQGWRAWTLFSPKLLFGSWNSAPLCSIDRFYWELLKHHPDISCCLTCSLQFLRLRSHSYLQVQVRFPVWVPLRWLCMNFRGGANAWTHVPCLTIAVSICTAGYHRGAGQLEERQVSRFRGETCQNHQWEALLKKNPKKPYIFTA